MDGSEQPSVKQQLVETIRGSESVVITTQEKPGKDAIAAAIGLHLLLEKLEKVAEVVITSDVPSQLQFLPHDFINKELQGQRDFVIELDQSRAEADSLKYVNENNKLKVYITPYNGGFVSDDVSFSYGDYHCDAIIGLGAHNVSDLAESVTSEQKLTQNATFLLINPGPGGSGTDNAINWNDPNAGSLCEMIMSMSEALGSGMLDEDVATALMTGIMERTQHFTNQTTTPKVMTMSAQLLAAGARQSEIVKQLSQPDQPQQQTQHPGSKESSSEDKQKQQTGAEEGAPNEFQLRQRSQGQDSSGEGSSPGNTASVSSSSGASVRATHEQTSGAQNQSQPQPTSSPQHVNTGASQEQSAQQSANSASPDKTQTASSSSQPQQSGQADSSHHSASQPQPSGQSQQATSSAQPSTSSQQSPSGADSQQSTGGQQANSSQAQNASAGAGNLDPQSQGAQIHPPPNTGNQQSNNQEALAAALNASGQNNQQAAGNQSQQPSGNQQQQSAPQNSQQQKQQAQSPDQQQSGDQQDGQTSQQPPDSSGGSDVEAARKAVEQAQQQSQQQSNQSQDQSQQ